MKLIIALIQPYRLDAVKRELNKKEITRITVLDATGHGRQEGQVEFFRGHEQEIQLLEKIELQIAVNENYVETAIEAIMAGARSNKTGQVGDGKIFVISLDEIVRISDGARGRAAI